MKRLLKDIEKHKDNVYLRTDQGEVVTYKEALDYSLKVEQLLPGRCFVFLFAKNTTGGLINYFTCLKNGYVPFILPSNCDKDFLDNLIKIYKPKYMFIPNEFSDSFSEFEIIFSEYDYSIVKTNYDDVKLHDDLCMLVSTSGTTGTEKLVRLSYDNVVENVMQRLDFMNKNFEYNNIEVDWNVFRSMLLMPFHYSYVLCMINTTIYTGASLLLSDKKAFEKGFWEFFIQGRSNSLFGVPLHCEILDKIGYFQMPNDYLKYITMAGAFLKEDLFDKCYKFSRDNNIVFDIGYGQTEASAVISELETDKLLTKKGSIGKGQIREELYLVDDDGNIIDKPDVMGELVVKGVNVALGYANDRSDLAKGDEFKGTLYTGDIAVMDEDGYFYIKGRKKRFVKLYGQRVNLDDVENMIKGKFLNIDVACIGKDNKIVILVNNKDCINDIELFILKKLKGNKKVISVKYVDEPLRNESGKVLYSKFAELYL